MDRATANFRDQLIAASLKLASACASCNFDRHFRDQLIAASLKLPPERPRLGRLAEFPRSIDRGLIEAPALPAGTEVPSPDFRDQLIAASLKQLEFSPEYLEWRISAIN